MLQCDEAKPQCERCRRTNRECSFQTVGPANLPPVAGGSSTDLFTIKEMELLHHFIMQTAESLINIPELQRTWQTGVIELALKYKFLMHTVLSLSAMHLAYLRPDESENLSVLAANHQDQALAGFRLELQNFNESNCHALFAASVLVIFYIPASSGTRINRDMTSSSFLNETLFIAIIDWLRLIRGCHHIILRGRPWLEQGPVKALMPREAWYRGFEAIDERGRKEDYYLASLEQLWTPDTPAQVMTYEDDELEAYRDALVKLRQGFTRMNVAVESHSHEKECVWCSSGAETPGNLDNRPSRVGAGVCWPMVISDKFFDLLENRKPVALVLLAHAAILIRRSSDAWWNGAPSMKIMSAVTATLPQEYHVWIEWPQREVGYTSHHRNSDAFMST